MHTIDTSLLTNWIVSGGVGLVFGIISAWFTHRYEKKRDDIAWKREKEKLNEQFDHDRELLELQFEQKLRELQEESIRHKNTQIRNELLRGIDDPQKAIDILRNEQTRLQGIESTFNSWWHPDTATHHDNKEATEGMKQFQGMRQLAEILKNVEIILTESVDNPKSMGAATSEMKEKKADYLLTAVSRGGQERGQNEKQK